MNFSTVHFGKPLADLTIQNIEKYFEEERSETDQLEFKSINPGGTLQEKFAGIQRTVCALLNSSGGLVIWGAPVGLKTEGQKGLFFKGELTYFNEILDKDYVISKISDKIIPLPVGIRIKVVIKGRMSMIILEVDQSNYSPHQADNTFFMRIDGQTRPAPHHYIEALFKKITYPVIESYLKIKNLTRQGDKHIVEFLIIFYNWSPLQNEENFSFRIMTDGTFSGANYIRKMNKSQGHDYKNENAKDIFFYGEPLIESHTVTFNKTEIEKNKKTASLTVFFGGKFSPRKSSDYLFDFEKIDDKDNCLKVLIENQLSKDIHEQKGHTKESIIRYIMKQL